jgi:hypothetical protein
MLAWRLLVPLIGHALDTLFEMRERWSFYSFLSFTSPVITA